MSDDADPDAMSSHDDDDQPEVSEYDATDCTIELMRCAGKGAPEYQLHIDGPDGSSLMLTLTREQLVQLQTTIAHVTGTLN